MCRRVHNRVSGQRCLALDVGKEEFQARRQRLGQEGQRAKKNGMCVEWKEQNDQGHTVMLMYPVISYIASPSRLHTKIPKTVT